MIDLNDYLKELEAHLKTGGAREHTYRPATERLFASFSNVQAANDQARTEHGATDFVFYKKSNINIILGYAEAKDINVSLDKTEKTEQLERYSGYNNLILTNYIEYRFYQNGKRYASVEIAKLEGLSLVPLPENFQSLTDELANFFEQNPEKIVSAKRLSQIMGAKARRIKSNINILLKQNQEDESRAVEITKIYQLMQKMLVADMSPASFADMYAQTLVYGLFVARYSDQSPEDFSRSEARDLVPHSNPFLRHFFDHIAGAQFESRLAVIVDELCEVFQVSDIAGIINKYLKLESDDKQGKDPVIHFYEDFLSEYDPAERKKMGAYYTPLPVVDYMVRAVDEVLKSQFGINRGLADSSTITKKVEIQGKKAEKTFHRVQVLDPATGTATFLNEIIKFVHLKFKGQEGMWPAYAKTDLIPRLSGFELMMGAYTIAHLKLGLTLKNLGVDDIGERLGVYLTNSLEQGIPTQPDLFSFGLADAVTSEAISAAEIKSERPIMVIIGNPPYSTLSSNMGLPQKEMVQAYKFINGEKIREKGALQLEKNLNDDYVKFIRLAQQLIEKNGEGMLAYITNNSFLDNPSMRAMRWSLSQTFDDIKIIDLHGNSKKKEVSPDGTKDENVFDIQQGVAIIIATKLKGVKQKDATVSVADIYGKRASKFDILNNSEIKFKQIKLDNKLYYFVDKNTTGKAEYEQGFSIADMFKINGVGIITARDKFIIAFMNEKPELLSRINEFIQSDLSNEQLSQSISVPIKKGWDMTSARDSLKFRQIEDSDLTKISYRPFDDRLTFYDKSLIWSQSRPTMKHFLAGENVGLSLTRQFKTGENYQHVLVNNNITESSYISNRTSEIGSTFPLWLYDEQGNKSSNLNAEIVKAIKLKVPGCNEQDIFDYIYGILHWPEYRKKYKEFLKIDFPRVPYPKNQAEFDKLKLAGERLRQLHLMLAPDVDDYITSFPISGTNQVIKLKYVCHPVRQLADDSGSPEKNSTGRVYINETQYFGGVPEAAWEFYIGGYQPAQKWLKDRKSRELGFEDIMHYQRIIKVLDETGKVMEGV